MKHMNKARVDFRCIAKHAYAIANHPMYEGSELSSSSTTISASPSNNEYLAPGTHVHRPPSGNIYHRVREYPVSGVPGASGAPLETWVNAHYEPACVHDPYYGHPAGESRHSSAFWSAPLQYGWPPQTAQPPLPDGTPVAAPRSRQRQNVRVINVHPGQADQDDRYRPTNSVRIYQVAQAAAPSYASDSASNPAYRSASSLSHGVRAASQQQEPPLRHRDASVSPRRSSHASSSSEISGAAATRRRDGSHTAHTSLDGSQGPGTTQPLFTSTLSQGRRPRSDHSSTSRTEDSPNAGSTAHIHVDSRSSSRSRSSSLTGSSPSTTFSRTKRGPPSSVPSSPATSFSIPSASSARDSGYSSGGSSVCEPDADRQPQHRQGDSRYPPNSHETRRGGYDARQERRRTRRARGR